MYCSVELMKQGENSGRETTPITLLDGLNGGTATRAISGRMLAASKSCNSDQCEW